MNAPSASPRPDFWFGSGEMGERIRSFDWASTPLGAFEDWPNSLKTAVRILLHSRYPMFIWWGPQYINIYNDAYIPVLGARHPAALGGPAPETWREIWDAAVGPQAEAVMKEGKGTWNNQALLVMERYGYPEETYFTFSYSPVPADDGTIGGVFCACTEETERVLSERRLRVLRQLSSAAAGAKTSADACRIAATTLAEHPHDIAFALIYLLDSKTPEARLAGLAGISPDSPAAVPELRLNGTDLPWPVAEAMNGQTRILRNLDRHMLPGGPWPEPCNTAMILPLVTGTDGQPSGFLIAGASPRRVLDDDYQGFFDLLAGGVASAIANAKAYEEARRRAEALAEIDRAKTIFFSNVSHEFRTPLTLMIGPLEDALSTAPDSLRPDIELAHRNALRLLRLVNTLLDFSRIEAGRMRALYRKIDLAQLTKDIASVFRSAIEKAGLEFTVDCPPLPEPAYVDQDMWEKIVLNLLSNAFKFTHTGFIRLSLASTAGRISLKVADSGSGIGEADIARIFDRFHRVEGAPGRTHEGSGIGLSLAHELVKLHGGEVQVQSRLGIGSTFTVEIPAGKSHLPAEQVGSDEIVAPIAGTAEPFLQEALEWLPPDDEDTRNRATTDREFSWARRPTKGDENARNRATTGREWGFASSPERRSSGDRLTRGTSGRVLLADDNADMRAYVKRILAPYYQVEAVADGEAALTAIERTIPDLVLSDVMMPRLDGIAMLRAIRADPRTSSLPVVLLTARADEASTVEGMQAGADDYLAKPFTARELLARVGGHIEIAKVRRESAEQLRASQAILSREVANFEALLRELPVGIAMSFDPECADIRVNPAFARMLGIDERQNASKTGPDRESLSFRIVRDGVELKPDELPMQVAAREKREVEAFEADIVRADGTMLRELGRAVPLLDPNGSVRGSLAVFLDITERRKAEDALRESEERFRNMAENAPVMIWITGKNGACTFINRQWCEFTGTALEQNLGFGWLECVHPEDRERAARIFLKATTELNSFRVEYRLRRHDGDWRWVVDSATQRLSEDGEFLGYIGSVIDMTERIEMERAIQTSEEQFSLAQAAAGVGTWNWQSKTNTTSFSGEYFSLYGLPNDHAPISYEEWLALIHPGDRERVVADMQRALRETLSLDNEFRVLWPNGSTRWLAGKGTVFCGEDGQPVRFTGVNYDITARKKIEQELISSNEDLKQFAFAVSHDLQEPLRIVTNYTQLLERRYKDRLDASAGKMIETAVNAAQRMEQLLRGLRDYLQVGTEPAPSDSIANLNDVVDKTLANLEDIVRQTRASITYGDLPTIAVPETPMIQVFQNLVGNAMKYRRPDRAPEIRITAEQRATEYVISVIDNGIGIDPQYQNQIFGIFRRLHGQEYSGAGMGLAICQKIVERFGGRIWVESELGAGSTFRFTVPAS
jgi:PAS domain S-box-containing protein